MEFLYTHYDNVSSQLNADVSKDLNEPEAKSTYLEHASAEKHWYSQWVGRLPREAYRNLGRVKEETLWKFKAIFFSVVGSHKGKRFTAAWR